MRAVELSGAEAGSGPGQEAGQVWGGLQLVLEAHGGGECSSP